VTAASSAGSDMKARATALYPFVPSGSDFARALTFFAELGFEVQWKHGGLAGLRYGAAFFFLQQIDVPEWQQNQMLTLEVDDLDQYWMEVASKDLARRFPGVHLKGPADYPWGREVHIIDPAGVCWHVRQTQKS
jgi:catechol 2,3-dioxygenase-like lactoylglutathione lyase family enzyme